MIKSPLREEPREQRAGVIRSKHESSLIDWLEANGRMVPRDNQEPVYTEEEEAEISGLIDPEDLTYDLGDDDEPDLSED